MSSFQIWHMDLSVWLQTQRAIRGRQVTLTHHFLFFETCFFHVCLRNTLTKIYLFTAVMLLIRL